MLAPHAVATTGLASGGSAGRAPRATTPAHDHAHDPSPAELRGAPSRRPGYFRTYAQITQQMLDLQRRYPHLVHVRVIGHTEPSRHVPSRPIYAMTLGRRGEGAAADRPRVMHVGGLHARETANPALLMRFANELVTGYGDKPHATAALDNVEIDIVPVLNATGYGIVERGFAGKPGGDTHLRKNPRGVDLNRNFDYLWGVPGGSSDLPDEGDYRGPRPASESETRALQRFLEDRRPDLFIDWHSFGRLNLYPWGHETAAAPDEQGLRAISDRFAGFNRHRSMQAAKLYPTSGTTDDYAYGKLGIPSFTIETGYTFHPIPWDYVRLVRENLQVLRFAARIADAPYERAQGPDAHRVRVVAGADGSSLSAVVSDARAGARVVAAAEWTQEPLSQPGTGAPMEAVDGAFDQVSEQVRASLPDGLPSRSLIYVRARDADGNWGPSRPQWVSR